VVPTAAGKAEKHSVDDVQPGKSAVKKRHFRGSHIGMASGTGEIGDEVGGSRAVRMTWQALRGRARKLEVSTVMHALNCSIGRSSLQVPLLAEREWFLRPTSHRATPHGQRCVDTYPGQCQAGILGRRASAMDLQRIHECCHVKAV
jgi:hypothetical protein